MRRSWDLGFRWLVRRNRQLSSSCFEGIPLVGCKIIVGLSCVDVRKWCSGGTAPCYCGVTLTFVSRLWSHHNLNDATHQNLGSFVGGVATRNLEQLEFMGVNYYVVDNEGQSLLTKENIERLRGIPIHFIHGLMNTVYSPESTNKDIDLLFQTFGNSDDMYTRTPFPDKGHLDCWMGHSSYRDVYVDVEEHAAKTIHERGLYKLSSDEEG